MLGLCLGLGIGTSAVVFSLLGKGRHCYHSVWHMVETPYILVFVIVIIQVVPHCAQPNNVSYTVIPSQRLGQRVTRFQEENVGTPLYLFISNYLFQREPLPQEEQQPTFAESLQQLQGKSSKIAGPLGASPQQEV